MDYSPWVSQVKRHHKTAFEYISNALKIDEDENGKLNITGVDEEN